jgi:membrane fusion protein (multidrug efflux system)
MTATPNPALAQNRRKGLTLIAAAVLLSGVGWGVWHWMHGRHQEATDNAYVAGNLIQITPQVGGTVVAVLADDTDFVTAGQPLIRLDAADAQLAQSQAEAQLAQTLREVRTVFANNATLHAQVSLREADLARAQADVQRSEADVQRRAPLVADGAVGQEELAHVRTQLTAAKSAELAARAAVLAARQQLAANQTQTDGTTPAAHPSVQRAATRVRETSLAVQRVTLLAPSEGQIARRSVQLGQRVQAGTPVMTLVDMKHLWVDANFKEGQLPNLRIGQPAELTSDVYGDKVHYHGTVVGLGAGTGSAFALLPAQNATGNWIKVVQRVPVRIALDAAELAEHPLRVGLSMEVTVDTQDQSGKALSDVPRTEPVAQTQVFDAQERAAETEVQRVLSGVAPAAAAVVKTPTTPKTP